MFILKLKEYIFNTSYEKFHCIISIYMYVHEFCTISAYEYKKLYILLFHLFREFKFFNTFVPIIFIFVHFKTF